MSFNNGVPAQIRAHIGTLGTNSRMNHLDLNVVSWYKNPPKLDLRYWTDDNAPDGKDGKLTLDKKTAIALRDLLNSIDLEGDDGLFLTLGTPLKSNDELCTVRETVKAASTKKDTGSSVLPW